MTRLPVRLLAPVSTAYNKAQRIPFANESLALLALVAIMFSLPDGLSGTMVVAGSVSAAPLILNAVGMVLIYRTNRFLNFAQIQVGVFAATLFDGLYRGQLLPHSLHNFCNSCVASFPGTGARIVNMVLSGILAMLAAALLSWLLYVLVIRRFSRAPVLVPSIVTIFLVQALNGFQSRLTSMLVSDSAERSGRALPSIKPPISSSTKIADFPVPIPTLVLMIAVPVILLATVVFLRRSSTGIAMRAAAENPGRASTVGVNVTAVTGRIWIIAGLLSGLAAVVTGLSGSVVGDRSTAPIIPIGQLVVLLTMLVVARFTSIWMAAAAGLVLSVLSTSVQVSFSAQAPLNALYVVLVGGLLLLQRDVSTRASREDFSGLEVARELRPIPDELRHLPTVRRYVFVSSAIGVLVLLGLPFAISFSQTALLTDALGLCIVGLSLLVLTGWGGQVSLGQFGFATIGGWTAAVSGLPFPLALLLGGLAGGVAAIIVGLPALKLKGLSLAISTIAFAVSAQAIFVDERYLGGMLPDSLTMPKWLGIDFGNERVIYYVTALILVLFCFGVMGLRRTRTGRALIALRSNEATAQAFGINALRSKLIAFSISGFMAAVAGAMLAFHLGRVAPASFTPDQSLVAFLYTVLGGLGGIAGPLLGMAFYAIVNFFFSSNALVQYFGAGLGAVLLMVVAPGGLAQLAYQGRDAMLRRLAYRLRIAVPSLMGDKGADLVVGRAVLDEPRRAQRQPGEMPAPSYMPNGQWALARRGEPTTGREHAGVR